MSDNLVELEHLTKHFDVKQGVFARGTAKVAVLAGARNAVSA